MSLEEINYLEAWFANVPRPLPDPVPYRQGEKIIGTEGFLQKHFAFVRANVNLPTLYEPGMMRLRQLKDWLIQNGHSGGKNPVD